MFRVLLLFLIYIPAVVLAGPAIDIEIKGIEGEYRDNVLNYLDIEKRKDNENFTVTWLKRLHAKAPDQIRAALEPYGYYNPDIDVSLTEKDGEWFAVYDVNLGQPVKVFKVDVSLIGPGAEEPILKQAVSAFPLKVGDILDHQHYEQGRSAIIEAASGYGYVKVKPEKAQVRVDRENNQAEIELAIDAGLRYYFGEVRVQQDFLDEDLVEDYITIESGKPFLNEDLLRFQQGLMASAYTSSVKIEPKFEEAVDDHVPLDVSLVPNKRHRIAMGAGFDTDRGPRVSGRWTNRRLNRYGHHSEVTFKFGTTQRELKGSYFIPVYNALTDRFATSARYEYEETSSTERETTEGELAFVRRNLNDTYLAKLFLQFFHETYRAGIQPETTTNLLPIVGGTLRFSQMEESLFPQRGHNLFGDLRGATSALLSDTGFLRLLLRGEYFYPLGSKGRLNLRTELGTSWVEKFLLYPVSLRYFAGGASSVRGFGYKDLGPKDPAGNVVGGKHLVTGSVEYDYRFLDKWAAAVFVDAGNAFSDTFEKLRLGSGLGFRWLAPFGSLKVDVALPVDESLMLENVQVYIGFGAVL
ncbi:MAG: outer membrane protein assembly factor [Gammaproteobacteria bacterium]|nr:outer membrane protein assembly factor [Gammaproteobacteria bacterium]